MHPRRSPTSIVGTLGGGTYLHISPPFPPPLIRLSTSSFVTAFLRRIKSFVCILSCLDLRPALSISLFKVSTVSGLVDPG